MTESLAGKTLRRVVCSTPHSSIHQQRETESMRKFLSSLLLLAVAVFWAGCAKDSSPMNSNATGTTTYNKTDAATSAPSGGGMSNSAAPKGTPLPVGIKPPTDK
jgi:hypothetical protein